MIFNIVLDHLMTSRVDTLTINAVRNLLRDKYVLILGDSGNEDRCQWIESEMFVFASDSKFV